MTFLHFSEAPISGHVTCEKSWEVFADGELLASGSDFTKPSYVEFSEDTSVSCIDIYISTNNSSLI